MKTKSIVIGLAAILSATVVPSALAAKTAAVDVESVSVGSSGNAFVKVSGADVNPAGCTFAGTYMIDGADPLKKEYMAILLTARAGGLQTKLSISNTVCLNSGNYAKISNVELL